MSAPNTTPGPWRVRDHQDKGFGLWVDAPKAIIENDRGPNYTRQILEDEDYPEKLADARLIAAAPELFDGAIDTIEALKLLRVGLANDPKVVEVLNAHIDELEYATAKARGDQ